jgi:predicted transcriptional regulator
MSVEKLPKVVELLRKESKASPSKIAEEIGSDRRTVEKILNVATDLGIVSCTKIEVSGRRYQACELNPAYKQIMRRRKD